MKFLITGHRLFKLQNYDIEGIKICLSILIEELVKDGKLSYGHSGMASGVDLWFCRELLDRKIPYSACIPFLGQIDTMEESEIRIREFLIKKAATTIIVRNSRMVEDADAGIVVWDGNKGGTHNVVQQLVEKKKPFHWLNPVSLKTYNCT